MSEIKIEQRRLFDWRLIAMLVVGAIVIFGIFAGVSGIRSASAKDRNTAVALAEVATAQRQVHELIEETKQQAEELKAKDVADEANLVRFAENQKRMLDFQSAELAWTRRLLNFIRTHPGQMIPSSLLTPPSAPRLLALTKGSSKSSSASRHHGKRKG